MLLGYETKVGERGLRLSGGEKVWSLLYKEKNIWLISCL